ncbi:hypothetical protein Droror1_Dr00027037 [Drosera rotundifolia]
MGADDDRVRAAGNGRQQLLCARLRFWAAADVDEDEAGSGGVVVLGGLVSVVATDEVEVFQGGWVWRRGRGVEGYVMDFGFRLGTPLLGWELCLWF